MSHLRAPPTHPLATQAELDFEDLKDEPFTVLNEKGLPILRHWYLVHREGKRLSPVASEFRRFVLTEVEHLIAKTI